MINTWFKEFCNRKLKAKPWINAEGLDIHFENQILWDKDIYVVYNIKAEGLTPSIFYFPEKSKLMLSWAELENIAIPDTLKLLKIQNLKQDRTEIVDIEKEIKEYQKNKKNPDVIDVKFNVPEPILEPVAEIIPETIPAAVLELVQASPNNEHSEISEVDAETIKKFSIDKSLIERVKITFDRNAVEEPEFSLAEIKQINLERKSKKLELEKEDDQFVKNAQEDLIDYKHDDLPLATNSLIEQLQQKHIFFYDLIARIQETHAPNDFEHAYHIQDKIAYLLNNKTLLYKQLVEQIIPLLDRINLKLTTYYDEITIKQQDLKNMNQQVSMFKEYSRKTEQGFEEIKEDYLFVKEDVEKLQNQKQDL